MLTENDLTQDQLDAIDFILDGEDSLLCADIGTGKTVISLTSITRSMDHMNRWLVLAPLLVATDTWAKEIDEWAHLQHLQMKVACGTEAQRLAALRDDQTDIVVINYENLSWLMDQFPRRKGKPDPLTQHFDGLICDEIDKLKCVSSKRFKSFRNRIAGFKKRIGLTGTLTPNDLTEVWGQTYLVDGGETFGRSFYNWRKEYFYPIDFNQYKWAPFPDTAQRIRDELSDITFRLKAKGLPEVVIQEPRELTMPPDVMLKYKELEKEFYLQVEDSKGRKRDVDAANAAVLAGKLQQMCAGFSYVDGGKEAVWHSKARFDWFEKFYAECEEQVLVFYHFNEELEELKRRHPGLAYLGSGASTKEKAKAIELWNGHVLPLLALHPASAGHGLNLQKSNAHHIVFLTMPWSGGLFKQAVGRLARRGNKAKKVTVHTALFKDTIDHNVFGTVTGKINEMEGFLDGFRNV